MTDKLTFKQIKSYCDDEEYIVSGLAGQLLDTMRENEYMMDLLEDASFILTNSEYSSENKLGDRIVEYLKSGKIVK